MPQKRLSESIIDILSIASLAPSVHNSQPWQVRLEGKDLLILPAKDRLLDYGDPTGRQTIISLGIFAEACVIALNYHGFAVDSVRLGQDSVIKLQVKHRPAKVDVEDTQHDVKAMQSRFTDRSIYQKVNISSETASAIEAAWKSNNVEIIASTRPDVIERCAELTSQGLSIALSVPGFRKELTRHLVPNSRTPYGIPLSTLQSGTLKSFLVKRLINSDRGQRSEAELERKRMLSASAMVFILADGDSPEYWLEGGRAYFRACLAIEKLGLRHATSASIVEAADFHEDIEKLLGTKKRILSLIRVGQSKAQPKKSGRFKPPELLIT